ncbi:MAG: hypothetical protein JWN38_42 [Candidatus Saccharibacteria bacterium]|nr:hypothetical protein [Candidatus Saccharibacteria bacterium]
MKICMITEFPPALDGIADYSDRLVKSQIAAEQEVMIIAPMKPIEAQAGVHRVLGFSFGSLKTTYKMILQFQPDVIHVQYCLSMYGLTSFTIFFALLMVKLRHKKIKTIATLHELQREQERVGFIATLFYTFFLKVYDGLMVHTEASNKLLTSKYGLKQSKVLTIPFPVYEFKNTALKKQFAEQKYKLGNSPMILCFGFIQVDKGIQYLLQGFASAIQDKSLDDARLIIAGDVRKRSGGMFARYEQKDIKYKAELVDYVKQNKLSKSVTFAGFVKNEEIYSLFDRADIIVIPYTKIEQSSVLGMSLAANRPIIASNVAGLGETLADTGLLVEPADSNGISQGIRRILTDGKYRKNLVHGYEILNQLHDQDRIARVTVDFYRSFTDK